ncbi:MAG: radical SAM protein [Promethearchaeota archaeon]
MLLPESVTLQLTEVCNLRCNMCYFWGNNGCFVDLSERIKPATMEFELIKNLVEELRPARPLYSFFGGEPLLHPQLEDIIHLIKSAGSTIDTPTNGTLLKEQALMLIKTGFDNVRVSIDGPKKINDMQRGAGSHDKAMEGIKSLYEMKKELGAKKPILSVIFTITPLNYHSIEKFFLKDLDIEMVDWITIQMYNFVTEEMGNNYATFLKKHFNIDSDLYWKGLVRRLDTFIPMNYHEIASQVAKVLDYYHSKGKNILLLPPTFTPENLQAYDEARWQDMVDLYQSCTIPWKGVDIMANGNVAPCHVFYDLTLGNLHENTFTEIWNSHQYDKFRSLIKERGLMPICNIGCCILYLSGKKLRKSRKKGRKLSDG